MELVIGVGVLLALVGFALGRVRDASLAKRISEEVSRRDGNDDR
jgi:VIT1/CCC1 family predicted Fe2+/Mn2+ transporter